MVSSPYYDDPESHLPINPALPEINEGDITMAKVDILNWTGDNGNLEFQPRLRERNDWIDGGRPPGLDRGLRAASDDDAPELDVEYDCD